MNAILLSDQLVLEERNVAQRIAQNIELLISSEQLQLKIANISVLHKTISEMYPVKSIREME